MASMTPEAFVEKFNAAPWDDGKLAEVASDVEGDVGEKARAFLAAREAFSDALDAIGYERG